MNLLSKLCQPIFDLAGRFNRDICDAEKAFNGRFGIDDSEATQEDLDAVVAGYQEEFKSNPKAQRAARWLGV